MNIGEEKGDRITDGIIEEKEVHLSYIDTVRVVPLHRGKNPAMSSSPSHTHILYTPTQLKHFLPPKSLYHQHSTK